MLSRVEGASLFHSDGTYRIFNTPNRLVTQKLINRANKLPLTKIKEIHQNKYVYTHQNGKMSNIDLTNKFCSCNTMADRGLCEHLVKVALIIHYHD